jgi:hypothetical protein
LLLKQAVMARLNKSGKSLVAKGIKVTEVIDHEWTKVDLLQRSQRNTIGVLLLYVRPQGRGCLSLRSDSGVP